MNQKRSSSHLKSLAFIQSLPSTMKQVVDATNTYLNKLDEIYCENRIQFRISGLFDVIIRLVSPFQMLHAHQGVPIDEHFIYYEKKHNEISPNIQGNDLSINWQQKNVQKIITSNLSSGYEQFFQNKKDLTNSKSTKQKKAEQKNKKGTRDSALTEQMQLKICEWIRDSYQNDVTVSNLDIMKTARQMTKSTHFKCGEGWFVGFRKRHPNVMDMIKLQKSREKENDSDDSSVPKKRQYYRRRPFSLTVEEDDLKFQQVPCKKKNNAFDKQKNENEEESQKATKRFTGKDLMYEINSETQENEDEDEGERICI